MCIIMQRRKNKAGKQKIPFSVHQENLVTSVRRVTATAWGKKICIVS